MTLSFELGKAAIGVRDQLARRNLRLVLAESCTAGNIASTLGRLPGISSCLCGSFVIYRNDSKQRWLGIPKVVLEDPGPVSNVTSSLLADAILEKTPEADVGLAITGDLGPGAPEDTDGMVFIAVKLRMEGATHSFDLKLASASPLDADDITRRSARLEEATLKALERLQQVLEG